MTWILSEVSELVAVAYSIRSTLKMLKHLSNINQNSTDTSTMEKMHSSKSMKDIENESRGALMFWSVFALYMMWERHLEFTIRWFPGYYYLKSFFIIVIAIPKLRIINLVFNDLVVPILEYLHKYIGKHEIPSASQFILLLPIYILLLCFPSIIDEETNEKQIVNNEIDTNVEINRIDSQYDDYDEVELVNDENVIRITSNSISNVVDEEVSDQKFSPNSKTINTAPYCVLYDDHIVDDDDIIKVKVRESSRRLSSLLPMIKQIETIETPAGSSNVMNRRQSLQSVYNFAKKLSTTKLLSPSKLKSMVTSSISSSKSTPTKPSSLNANGNNNISTPTRAVPNNSTKLVTPKSPIQDMSKAVVNTVRSVLNGGDYKNSIFNIHNPSSNSVIRDKRRQTLMLKCSSETKSYQQQSPVSKSSTSLFSPPKNDSRYDTPKASPEIKRSPSPPSSITTRKRKSVKPVL